MSKVVAPVHALLLNTALPGWATAGPLPEAAPPPDRSAAVPQKSGQTADEAVSSARSLPGESESPALRTEQAWLLKLRLQPEAGQATARLARLWQGLVLQALKASGPALLPAAAASLAEKPAEAAPLPGTMHGPVYALPGWQGQVLLLRLLDGTAEAWPAQADAPGEHSEDSGDSKDAGEQAGLSLSLRLSLAGEPVQILLQWRQGLLLRACCADPDTLQALRGLLPRIAARLAAVPLLLRHCQLSLRPAPSATPARPRQLRALAHAGGSALFRAAAEISTVLLAADGDGDAGEAAPSA